ncbi:hypothetical protein PPYR_13187 [Photinus pyralis]|uniref:CRAL-TRIO domain-containing protein n=2 Tax=Photinus pyralis TaxID=7054 RepID=A0A5N4A8D3_PHOPY|nr:hypothetical protein PPYR_13187 [Photinus pyralis]
MEAKNIHYSNEKTRGLLQQKAIKELNEDPARLDEHLLHIRKWLEKQPHLSVRSDDHTLLTFLRGCKWSLQRAKEKIDYFWTIHSFLPDLYLDRDPYEETMQRILRNRVLYPLPNPVRPDGPRILYLNLKRIDFASMPLFDLIKLFLMCVDVLLQEDENFIISGMIIMYNGGDLPLSYLLQFTPDLMKKIIISLENAYPIRIKELIWMNCSSAVEKIFNHICIPLMSKKLASRLHLITEENTENAYEYVPLTFFPEELGGTNGLFPKVADDWKMKMESKKEWFLEEWKYGANEKLRPCTSKLYSEEFGMEGTFRKLNLD